MEKKTIEQLKAEFSRLGYQWSNFMIVGIRSKADVPDAFDDLIGLVENDSVTWFTATTNPGVAYLKKLLNPKGCAVLKPGQYLNTWELGLHQGKYLALCQRRPVTVYRDADLDNKSEETAVTDTGLFGINLHRANSSIISKIIGNYSAGCQVFSNPVDFNYLITRCKASGLKQFTYTLLKEF